MRLFELPSEPFVVLTPTSLWGIPASPWTPEATEFAGARAELKAHLPAVAARTVARLRDLTRVGPEPLAEADGEALVTLLQEWLHHWQEALALEPAWMRLNLHALCATHLAPRLDCSHQEWAFLLAALDASLQGELSAASSLALARELAPLVLASGHLSYLQAFWREREAQGEPLEAPFPLLALYRAMQADRLGAPERSCWLAAWWEAPEQAGSAALWRRLGQDAVARLRPRVERSWLDLWEESWLRVESNVLARERWEQARHVVADVVGAAAANLREGLDAFRAHAGLEADLEKLLQLAVRECACGSRLTAREAVARQYLSTFPATAAKTVAAALQTSLRQRGGALFEQEEAAWEALAELPAAGERAVEAQAWQGLNPALGPSLQPWVEAGPSRGRRRWLAGSDLTVPVAEGRPEGPAQAFLNSLSPLVADRALAGRLWNEARALGEDASRRVFERLPEYAARSGPGALAKCATDNALTLARAALALELEEGDRSEFLGGWWNLLVNAYVSTRPAGLFPTMLEALQGALEARLGAAATTVVKLLAPNYESALAESTGDDEPFKPLRLHLAAVEAGRVWSPPDSAWPPGEPAWRELLLAQRAPYARTGFLEGQALERWSEATTGRAEAADLYLGTLRERCLGQASEALEELLWLDYLQAWQDFQRHLASLRPLPAELGRALRSSAPVVARWEALRWLAHHGWDSRVADWAGPAAEGLRDHERLLSWLRDPEPLFAADPREDGEWRRWLRALIALAAWQPPLPVRAVLMQALELGWPRCQQPDYSEQVRQLREHLASEGLLGPGLSELLEARDPGAAALWCPTGWGLPLRVVRGILSPPEAFAQAWREAGNWLERRLVAEAWTGQEAGPEWSAPGSAARLALTAWEPLVEAAVRWEGRPLAHPGPAGPAPACSLGEAPTTRHASAVGLVRRSLPGLAWNGSLGAGSALGWRALGEHADDLEKWLIGWREQTCTSEGPLLGQLLELDLLQAHLEQLRQVRAGVALTHALASLETRLSDQAVGLALVKRLALALSGRSRREALHESALALLESPPTDWPVFFAACEGECQALLAALDLQEVRQWLRRLSGVSRRLGWAARVCQEAPQALAGLPEGARLRGQELIAHLLALGPLECVPHEVRAGLRADLAARHPHDGPVVEAVVPALKAWFLDLDLTPLEAELKAYAEALDVRPPVAEELEGAARRLAERLPFARSLDADFLGRLLHMAVRGQAPSSRWGIPRWLWLAGPAVHVEVGALSPEDRERLAVALGNVLAGLDPHGQTAPLTRSWLEAVSQLSALEVGWAAAQGQQAAEAGLVRRLALEGWSGSPSGDGALEWLAYEVVPQQGQVTSRQITRALGALAENFSRAGTLPPAMVEAAEGLRTLAEYRLSRPGGEGQSVLSLLQVADDGLTSPRPGRKSWWERLTSSIGELVGGG